MAMRRAPAPRALQRLVGLGRSSLCISGRQAAPLATGAPHFHQSSSFRLACGSHWRGFTQQVRTDQEQEPVTSSKASTEGADKAETEKAAKTKADADAEAKAESGGADAKTEEAKADKAAAEAEVEPEVELSPVERLQKELDELQEKSRAKKKELLLGLADFQNNNKKSLKERESRRRSATANFGRRMIDVYSEFEELQAFKSEVVKDEGSPVLALQEGVSLTRDLFKAALERSNVERLVVEPGTPVVASRHEVVGTAAGDGSHPAGSLAEVTEDGWVMDLRSASPQVLRKAKVKTFE